MEPRIRDRLSSQMEELGIVRGDSLLVHSSLRSMGPFADRPKTTIEALKAVLGPSGNLLMPALSFESVVPNNPVFDQAETASCVGGLTEYFRQLTEVRRSIHPTHSVCAIGPETGWFLDNHYLDHTPCGPESPFRKLLEARGKILFLGCGLSPNTSMHAIEELTEPPYLFGEPTNYLIRPIEGKEYNKIYVPHNFKGFVQRYERVLDSLNQKDYSKGALLAANCFVVLADSLWNVVNKKLKEDPLFFVESAK